MKKVLMFVTLLIMVLFVGCGGKDSAKETEETANKPAQTLDPALCIWEKGVYLDAFNQPTSQTYIGTKEHVSGTFNNSAVTDGDLEAEVRVDGSIISIILYEYKTQKVKNGGHSGVDFTILVKRADGKTFTANGVMESGADCITITENQVDCVLLGPDTENNRATSIATALCADNGEVSFYITRADQPATNYLFTAKCGNFQTLYNEGIARIIQELAYTTAEGFLADNQLNEAWNMFIALGAYSDSAERARAVQDEINAGFEREYQAAETLVKEGKLGAAAISFWSIGDYKDAHDRSLKLWAKATDRKTIAAGGWHTVAVKNDGTVVATGAEDRGQKRVSKWSNIVAVDSTLWTTVGLKADGTVVACGDNDFGQCDVSKWKDIVAIASGVMGTMGLKADGTVVLATNSRTGIEKDVAKWRGTFTCIAGGWYFVGLKADGSVVSTGADVSKWKDIVAIASGDDATFEGRYVVGLKADGTVVAVGDNDYGQCNVSDWRDIVSISAGIRHTVGLKSDGTVVATGYNGTGECNVSNWSDIVSISAGGQHTIGLKADGTVVSTGYNDNGDGQCNVDGWKDIKLPDK